MFTLFSDSSTKDESKQCNVSETEQSYSIKQLLKANYAFLDQNVFKLNLEHDKGTYKNKYI